MKQIGSSFSNQTRCPARVNFQFMVKLYGLQKVSTHAGQRLNAILDVIGRAADPERNPRIGLEKTGNVKRQNT